MVVLGRRRWILAPIYTAAHPPAAAESGFIQVTSITTQRPLLDQVRRLWAAEREAESKTPIPLLPSEAVRRILGYQDVAGRTLFLGPVTGVYSGVMIGR